MIAWQQFVGLAVASVLIIVVPGPSVLFVVGRALSYGRRTALFSIVGNSIGSYVAAVCVAMGLGSLLQQSEVFFQVVKLLGAAYLVWLGIQGWRHAGDGVTGTAQPGAAPAQQPWRSVRTGILVGVTNPKAFILFGAILPQFVDPSAGAVPVQMLVLAVCPIAIGLVTDTVWGLLAGRAREWLSRTRRRMVVLGRVGGVSMVGLGLSVAVTGRHD